MKSLMEQHRQILKPKFDCVEKVFSSMLGQHSFARWSRPDGGYFVSLEVRPGTAKSVVDLAAKAGVTFATPGSCFPYGIDVNDSQLRIAPSLPDLESLNLALEVIATCVINATCRSLENVTNATATEQKYEHS